MPRAESAKMRAPKLAAQTGYANHEIPQGISILHFLPDALLVFVFNFFLHIEFSICTFIMNLHFHLRCICQCYCPVADKAVTSALSGISLTSQNQSFLQSFLDGQLAHCLKCCSLAECLPFFQIHHNKNATETHLKPLCHNMPGCLCAFYIANQLLHI